MIEQFSNWLVSKQGEIEHVSSLLATELSHEPAGLVQDLIEIEAWYQRVGELLANANAQLDRAKRFYLPDRSEATTEADRRSYVDEKVADIRKTRDILESMLDAIKHRLILGESILRFEKPTHTPEYKEQSQSLRKILEG